jgi:hypothetical protein
MEGHTIRNAFTLPLPYEYITEDDLPSSFTWGDVGNGNNYLTKSLNQHIPQVNTLPVETHLGSCSFHFLTWYIFCFS